MSQGSSVRDVIDEIRGALKGRSPEALQEILTYVFKEYVVESRGLGPRTAALISGKSELDGMSFVELIRWMQLHLDAPELAQFQIEGTRVLLKAGGQSIPIESAQARPEPLLPTPATSPPPASAEAAAPPPPPASAPRPTSAPRPAAPPPRPVMPAPPLTPSAQPSPPSPPAEAKSEATDADDNAKRFSLLEVD